MHFTTIHVFLLLALLTALSTLIAARLRIAYPIVMVVAGLGIGFVPGLPHIALDPEMVFVLFLPPILMAAAYFMPWTEFRDNLRPILLLAVGLVLVTTVAVGYAAHWVIGLPLAAGFVLGAIVSPPDAVAASSVAREVGLPRRVVTILEGESLVNDATGLVLYQLALAAILTGGFSLMEAGGRFALVAVGGVGIGLAIGWLAQRIMARIRDLGVVTVMSLLVPYAAYIAAEAVHVSGVLAVVAAGLYIGWHGSRTFDAEQRTHVTAVWDSLIYLLNGLVFILIGLQVPAILAAIKPYPAELLVLAGAAVAGVTILVRIMWVFPATLLPRLLSPALRRRDPTPRWGQVTVVAWAGMRGIVSLAAALALPPDLPGRGLVLYLAYVVILVTLVGQGLTLGPLICRLGLSREDIRDEEWGARQIILQAGQERLAELVAAGTIGGEPADLLAGRYAALVQLWQSGEAEARQTQIYRQAAIHTLQAEHDRLLELRRFGVVSDDTFRKLERDIDLRFHALPDAPPG